MRSFKKSNKLPKTSNTFLKPVLPLVPEVLPTNEEDKTKFKSFELKTRAGQPAGSTSYKKYVRVFEEDSPAQWIELMRDLNEIWTQNSVNGATDRASTIRALLKGESLTAFEAALEDARRDPDPAELAPIAMTVAFIEQALAAVASTVFPLRALELQKLWMNQAMKKPFELSTRKTAAAITRINNCLPVFPTGTANSKFTDAEVVGLLEWSLPPSWRAKFDLDGYIPTLDTKAKLILECEAIERNQTESNDNNNKETGKTGGNNKNSQRNSGSGNSARSGSRSGSREHSSGGDKYCSECGHNKSHTMEKCYKLINRREREERNASRNKPFSKRTFRKEVNVPARKAGKKKVLDLFEASLNREKKKLRAQQKRAKAKAKHAESDDSFESDESLHLIDAPHSNSEGEDMFDSEESIQVLDKPIPRKKKVKKTSQKDYRD